MESNDELSNEELPLKVLLLRYIWPFWLFRDASQGGLYARAAAYRHNSEMSVHLPTYIRRWCGLCAITLLAMQACCRIQAEAELHKGAYAILTAGVGMTFTCCFAFVCIIASIYARFRFE